MEVLCRNGNNFEVLTFDLFTLKINRGPPLCIVSNGKKLEIRKARGESSPGPNGVATGIQELSGD